MNGAVIQSTEDQITQKGLEESSAKLVPPGSLLIVGRSGILERKLPVGVTAVECTANQDLKVLTPFVSGMARYIRLILKGFETYILDELVKTGTTVRSLKYTEFQLHPYPLPPLEEEQRIVETVERLMEECDELEQQQERERTLQVQVGTSATEALQSADEEALRPAWERVREHFDTVTATPEGVDTLRQTILQLAVQGRLTERDPGDTPADELLERIQQEKQRLYDAGKIRKPKTYGGVPEGETPFNVPSEWEWAYLGKIGRWGAGSTPKRSNSDYWDGGSIPWLKIGDLNNAHVEKAEEHVTDQALDECTFKANQPGDVAVGMYGSIGKLGILELECVTNQAICVCTPMGGIPSRYLFYYLRTARETFEDLGAGGAQQNISKTKIVNTPLPLPPLEEQQRIVDAINRLLPLCDRLHEHLNDLNGRGEQLLEAALRDASVSHRDTMLTEAAA